MFLHYTHKRMYAHAHTQLYKQAHSHKRTFFGKCMCGRLFCVCVLLYTDCVFVGMRKNGVAADCHALPAW